MAVTAITTKFDLDATRDHFWWFPALAPRI
jgi:hypothetical protein